MARPRLNKRVVRVTVSLDERPYGDLLEMSREQEVSLAWLIRRAVTELIEARLGERTSQLPLTVPRVSTQQSQK